MLLDDTVLPDTIRLPDGSRVPYNLSSRGNAGGMPRPQGLDPAPGDLRPRTAPTPPTRPTASPSATTPSRCLQPQGPNRYAVFFTHARETIDFHYERKLFKVCRPDTLADPQPPPPNASERRPTPA